MPACSRTTMPGATTSSPRRRRAATTRGRSRCTAGIGELGLMGMTIPEEYGGAGADTVAYAMAVEELTRVESSVAITMAAHHSLGTLPIYYYGGEEQKQQWLPELAS